MLGCTSVHIILIMCFIMKLLSVIRFLFNSNLPGNVEMHFISDLRRPLVLMGHDETSFLMFIHFCALCNVFVYQLINLVSKALK